MLLVPLVKKTPAYLLIPVLLAVWGFFLCIAIYGNSLEENSAKGVRRFYRGPCFKLNSTMWKGK